MGTSSLRAGTRRGRAGSARRGIRLAACCDSRRQGNSRAQGLLVVKLAGGAAIVAALGADEGLQGRDELTRRGKRENGGELASAAYREALRARIRRRHCAGGKEERGRELTSTARRLQAGRSEVGERRLTTAVARRAGIDHGAARRGEALCNGVDGREHGEVATRSWCGRGRENWAHGRRIRASGEEKTA
jgi:hypothetical protein